MDDINTATGSETAEIKTPPLADSDNSAPETVTTETTDKAEAEAPEKSAEDKAASDAAKTLAEHKKVKAQERWKVREEEIRIQKSRAEAAEYELRELKATLKKPEPDKYDDNAEYTADLAVHRLRENDIAQREATARRHEAEIAAKVDQAWRESFDEAREAYPDFDAKVTTNNSVVLSHVMIDYIKSVPGGYHLAYDFGNNPAEASRISSLPPLMQVRELAKMEANRSVKPTKRTTQAPEPITSIRGGGAQQSKGPEGMPFAEYKKWREAGGKI